MAPTDLIMKDFWCMAFENYTSLIIMLCPESEGNKEMSAKYYESKDPENSFEIGEYTV